MHILPDRPALASSLLRSQGTPAAGAAGRVGAPAKPPGADTEPGSELAPSARQLQRFCGFHRFHDERGRTALGALTGWEKLLLLSSLSSPRLEPGGR